MTRTTRWPSASRSARALAQRSWSDPLGRVGPGRVARHPEGCRRRDLHAGHPGLEVGGEAGAAARTRAESATRPSPPTEPSKRPADRPRSPRLGLREVGGGGVDLPDRGRRRRPCPAAGPRSMVWPNQTASSQSRSFTGQRLRSSHARQDLRRVDALVGPRLERGRQERLLVERRVPARAGNALGPRAP